MRPDDNWIETRLLAEDLDILLGLPRETTEEFLKVLENLIIHRFIEKVSSIEDIVDKDISIELPYLGNLVVSFDNNKKISTNFVVRNSFYNKLKKAYFQKESPLVSQISKILGEDLVKKYEEGIFDGN